MTISAKHRKSLKCAFLWIVETLNVLFIWRLQLMPSHASENWPKIKVNSHVKPRVVYLFLMILAIVMQDSLCSCTCIWSRITVILNDSLWFYLRFFFHFNKWCNFIYCPKKRIDGTQTDQFRQGMARKEKSGLSKPKKEKLLLKWCIEKNETFFLRSGS